MICGGRADVPPLQVYLKMRFFDRLMPARENKKEQTPEGICSGTPEGTRLHFLSHFAKENRGVAAVEPGGKQMPTGHLL